MEGRSDVTLGYQEPEAESSDTHGPESRAGEPRTEPRPRQTLSEVRPAHDSESSNLTMQSWAQ